MSTEANQTVNLFCCYAHEDRELLEELETHLSHLKRQYNLKNWYDRKISPGTDWEKEIYIQLNEAHLILLLISANFMASDYCYGKEMEQALARHKAGMCRVIPILLRPTDWGGAPFSHLQMLPLGAKPVTSWPNRDEAFENVAKGIREVIKDLLEDYKEVEKTEASETTHTLSNSKQSIRYNKQEDNISANRAEPIFHEVRVGQVYTGKVCQMFDYGCIVEILPGKEGLVDTSQLADYQVNHPADILSIGDEIAVIVTKIDHEGNVTLSRRALLSIES